MTSSGTSGRGPIRGRLGARIRQRLLVVFAAAVAILLPALVAPTQAYAAVTAAFELDGNVLDNAAPPPDWGRRAEPTASSR
jgi:hypothetical protein